MKLTERQLRKIIRKEVMMCEGIWDNLTDLKKWKQFGNSTKRKLGYSEKNLNLDGYLSYIFSETEYCDILEDVFQKVRAGEYFSDSDIINRISRDISINGLGEYLGVVLGGNETKNNPKMKEIMVKLIYLSSRQLASSKKYFDRGGIDDVLRMKKSDISSEFDQLCKDFMILLENI